MALTYPQGYKKEHVSVSDLLKAFAPAMFWGGPVYTAVQSEKQCSCDTNKASRLRALKYLILKLLVSLWILKKEKASRKE